jgi:hypothetical protein
MQTWAEAGTPITDVLLMGDLANPAPVAARA